MKLPKRNDPPAPAVNIQEGKDVFISYSRVDQDWVRWLNERFLENQRKPWIDWSGIQPGEEWWPSILRGIDAANTFLFVLSPDSLRSQVCPKEIDRAVSSGKRIVPVVCRDIHGLEVYPALARLNYIFLRTEEEQEANLPKLYQALDTDLDHVRAHTKFLIRAREWEARQQSGGYLLRGGLLKDADEWLTTVGGKLPEPTELHAHYILASRKAARRSQRVTMGAITGGLVLALGLAALAGWQYLLAEERRVETDKQRRVAEAQTKMAEARRVEADEQRQKAQENYVRAEDQRKQAEDATSKAQKESALRSDLLREAARSEHLRALDRADSGFFQEALAHLARSLRYSPGYQPAEEAAAQVIQIASAEFPRTTLAGHTERILSIRFSPDGRSIVTTSKDRTARIWDTENGATLGELRGHTGSVTDALFIPDGQRTLTTSEDGTIRMWDAATYSEIFQFADSCVVENAELSQDGTLLLAIRKGTSSPRPSCLVWETANGKLLWEIKAPTQNIPQIGITGNKRSEMKPIIGNFVHSAHFNRDGSRVVATFVHGGPRVYEARSGKFVSTLAAGGNESSADGEVLNFGVGATDAFFTPDGSKIYSFHGDGYAYTSDAITGRSLAKNRLVIENPKSVAFDHNCQTIFAATLNNEKGELWWPGEKKAFSYKAHRSPITAACFSPDSRRILTSSSDGTAHLWGATEPITGSVLAVFRAPSRNLDCPATFNHLGALVAAAGGEQGFLWDAQCGQALALFRGSKEPSAIEFSEDGERVFTWDEEGRMGVWSVETGLSLTEQAGSKHREPCTPSHPFVAFGPGTCRLASGDDSTVIVTTGQEVIERVLKGHSRKINAVTISENGREVLTASDDQTARLWDTRTGSVLTVLNGHRDYVTSVRFSSDEREILTASDDGTARLWSRNGKCLWTVHSSFPALEDAQLSPNGRRLLVISNGLVKNGGAELWDPRSAERIVTFTKESAVLAPDGTRVASWGETGHVRLWSSESGVMMTTFQRHNSRINDVAISPDGRHIAIASENSRIWDLLPPERSSPDWFPDFLVWLGGMEIGDDGEPKQVPVAKLEEIEQKLATINDTDRKNPYIQFLKWRRTPARDRPLTPYGTTFRRSAADQLLDQGGVRPVIEWGYLLAPGHPLVQLQLAGFEQDKTKAEFLRAYSLKNLQDEPVLLLKAALLLEWQKQYPQALNCAIKALSINSGYSQAKDAIDRIRQRMVETTRQQ